MRATAVMRFKQRAETRVRTDLLKISHPIKFSSSCYVYEIPVNFKLRAIARERERAPAVMRFQQRAETRARTGFTIDFTFYKVLIIILMSLMFMADVCYIFIYIIK